MIEEGVGSLAPMLRQGSPSRVLELGTAQSMPGRATHHREWFPAATWVMSDIEPGADVDVAADAHRLPFATRSFDAVIACSVYEHLARPWVAAREAARVLARGGALYVQTHQTFPIHGYPSDFWRFTREALALIAADAGLEVEATSYEYPATITPPNVVFDRGWNTAAPSFLNVEMLARKR